MSRRRVSLLLASVALAAVLPSASGCSGAQEAADARTTVVSLRKIDCVECGDEIVADLRTRPGVYDARFLKRRAEVYVRASPTFDVFTQVRRLAAAKGYEALLGAGQGRYLDWATFPPGADALTVARDGQDVADLSTVLAQGKVTVVDFSAAWCVPCRKVDEHMAKLLGGRKDVAYRKLDIGDWDTPLARRYLRDVPSLPYVVIFSPRGEKVDSFAGLDLARLDRAIESALGS